MYMRVYKKRRDVFKKISDVDKVPNTSGNVSITAKESSKYDGIDVEDLFDDKTSDIYFEIID